MLVFSFLAVLVLCSGRTVHDTCDDERKTRDWSITVTGRLSITPRRLCRPRSTFFQFFTCSSCRESTRTTSCSFRCFSFLSHDCNEHSTRGTKNTRLWRICYWIWAKHLSCPNCSLLGSTNTTSPSSSSSSFLLAPSLQWTYHLNDKKQLFVFWDRQTQLLVLLLLRLHLYLLPPSLPSLFPLPSSVFPASSILQLQ